MGAIIGPVEEEEGYDKNFSAAVNIATAPTGLLIPPSNVMITFAMVSGGTSIAALLWQVIFRGFSGDLHVW